jgi:DNA mismatch endonuclease (patch repair protein)
MDRFTPKVRSQLMSRIGGRDTDPERVVRRVLRAAGYGYRLHREDLAGTPDIVMIGRRIAIFVHGCYWHRHEGCRNATIPRSNTAFWEMKFARNVERDRRIVDELRRLGWRVLTVWECATRKIDARASLALSLRAWIESCRSSGEIPEPLYVAPASSSVLLGADASQSGCGR